MKLELELDSDSVARGGKMAGRVNVIEGGDSRSLVLTLAFHEHSSGYSAVPLGTDIKLADGPLATGRSIEFSFDLPADAPPSVKAKHSELYWDLVAHSDEPGIDTRVTRRVVVL